jgi:hypothetical protein
MYISACLQVRCDGACSPKASRVVSLHKVQVLMRTVQSYAYPASTETGHVIKDK